jgi:crossover junction endodeoxyribonuclease RuvC
MKTTLGVDVGMNGAFAFYDGAELIIYDMPVFERNKTRRVDAEKVKRIFNSHNVHHAYVEQVNAFGMGASSAYNFGWSCGIIEGVLSCCAIPFTYVTPQKWKKALSVPTDKDGARMRASQLLPKFAHNWDRKKDDGRAEASLIALYGHGAPTN